MASDRPEDEEFAEEILNRIVDQHEATIGDEGVVYVGDDEDFESFISGLMSLSEQPSDPVVRAFEPTEAGELAAALWDAPGRRVVMINEESVTHCPTYIWYDTQREEMRSAVFIPDDDRSDTPCLGETGRINNSVWGAWFERAVDDSNDRFDYELLEPHSTPDLVQDHIKSDCESYAPVIRSVQSDD